MKENISNSELNRMAEIDGESPFFSANEAASPVPAETEEALLFSSELRRHLATGIAKEALPDEWIDLVQKFELPTIDQSSNLTRRPSSIFGKVRDVLFHFLQPNYALGGAFSIALVGVVFFQMQTARVTNDPSSSWTDLYATIEGAPKVSRQYDNTFVGAFFDQPRVEIRGIETLSSSNIGGADEALSAVPEEPVLSSMEAPDIKDEGKETLLSPQIYEDLALTVRAMELQDQEFGRIAVGESFIWIAIRGEIGDPVPGKSKCKLLQVSPGSEASPEYSRSNTFLSYCPAEWTKKITLLGRT